MSSELVNVKWNVASNVKILVTKKNFFFKKNFNLSYMNDKYSKIKKNREDLNKLFPSIPYYIKQVHGNRVINLDNELNVSHVCDGLVTRRKNQVIGVLTADCLPVFISKKDGSMVGVAHAGWRGLLSGVIENLIEAFNCKGSNLVVHLGPAISMNYFEVGEEIQDLYLSKNINFLRSFSFRNNKHYLDLYDAARVILEGYKISSISGGNRCTFEEVEYFFSYRRDGVRSGRMAHLIWMK